MSTSDLILPAFAMRIVAVNLVELSSMISVGGFKLSWDFKVISRQLSKRHDMVERAEHPTTRLSARSLIKPSNTGRYIEIDLNPQKKIVPPVFTALKMFVLSDFQLRF